MAAASRAGPYELLKPLSSGGMGEVFVARLLGRESDKRVAVKLMLAYLVNEPELVTRFLDEVRLAARMKHPNVVQIFDVGMTDNRPWLAMELVEGVSLYALLERCRQRNEVLPLPLVRLIAQGLLDALAYAHGLGGLQVIHRDVSPSNILVSVDGAVRLTDFGLARAKTNASKTSPGGLKAGKLGYMAPEVALPDAAVDQRADVFSAGVTLFETLTLLQPFRRLGASDAQTLAALSRGDALKPAAARGDVSAAMEAALLKAMRPAPADRFASAAELKAAFVDGDVADPAELGAAVRRLCPEELARFFSLDEVPSELFEPPTVSFTLGPAQEVTILGPTGAQGVTSLTSVEAIIGATGVTEENPMGPLGANEPVTTSHRAPRPLLLLAALAFIAVAAALVVVASVARVSKVAPAPAPAHPAAPLEPSAVETDEAADSGEDDAPELELMPNPMVHMGYLTAECEPSALVYLDGKPLASTPVIQHIVPIGRHVVTFKTKRGDVRRKILVLEGKSVSVRVSGK